MKRNRPISFLKPLDAATVNPYGELRSSARNQVSLAQSTAAACVEAAHAGQARRHASASAAAAAQVSELERMCSSASQRHAQLPRRAHRHTSSSHRIAALSNTVTPQLTRRSVAPILFVECSELAVHVYGIDTHRHATEMLTTRRARRTSGRPPSCVAFCWRRF